MLEKIKVKFRPKYKRTKITGSYTEEISNNNKYVQELNQLDLRDIYRLSNYYGYEFNKHRKTLKMNNEVYNVIRLKGKMYAKSDDNVIQLNKLVKLTKCLRASRLDKLYK